MAERMIDGFTLTEAKTQLALWKAAAEEIANARPTTAARMRLITARALAAAEVERLVSADGKSIEWKRELSARLVALQKADGSWANDNNRFWEADPVLCTSFAMIALELCR